MKLHLNSKEISQSNLKNKNLVMSKNFMDPLKLSQASRVKIISTLNSKRINVPKANDSFITQEIVDFNNAFLYKPDKTLRPKIFSKKFSNKGIYTGELSEEGKRQGIGSFKFEGTNDIYCGEWDNDLFHGNGTYYFASGDKYIGQLKEGRKEGSGKYLYKNGNIYQGAWKNDVKEGTGKMTYENRNELYEGKLHYFYEVIFMIILNLTTRKLY